MISAIILTHNNQNSIERTIKSVSFCDEIILIDDTSTDDTVSIALSYKCLVHTRPLDNDFSGQRNFGLARAKGDWVLFIDSDEVVTGDLRREIIEAIHDEKTSGYLLKRTDVFLGHTLRYGETAHVRLLRLARKNAGTWIRPVHETWDVRGTVKTLDHPIMYYPHTSISEFTADINRYSSLHATALRASGKSVPPWHIVVYPCAKFLVNYVFRQGFRDGTAGFVMAVMMSFHSFLARSKAYLAYRV